MPINSSTSSNPPSYAQATATQEQSSSRKASSSRATNLTTARVSSQPSAQAMRGMNMMGGFFG